MSKTIIADIRNNTFPPLTVKPGTHVVWRNLDPYPHSAETETISDFFFNAGPMLPGETSAPVLFLTPGTTSYRCRYHAGMTGTVIVDESLSDHTDNPEGDRNHTPAQSDRGQSHGGLNHLHGFVTGGRSGKRFFMSHTPVLADPRHNFQVILQGSLTDQKHIDAYNAIRNSDYGDRRIQIFQSHTSLPDIGSGKIKLLPTASFA